MKKVMFTVDDELFARKFRAGTLRLELFVHKELDKAIPQKIHYTCTPRAKKKLAFNNLFQSSGQITRSEDQDDPKSKNSSNEFGFGEYAETVGPQGLLFVLKGPDIPNLRVNWQLARNEME